MRTEGPFRISFLDGEPPLEACRGAAEGIVELVEPSRTDHPGLVEGVVLGGPLERRGERVSSYLREGVAVLATASLAADAAEHDELAQAAEDSAG